MQRTFISSIHITRGSRENMSISKFLEECNKISPHQPLL